MGLPRGKTNNPRGRPKGSMNKINYDLREVIGEFLAKRLNRINEVYDQLTPREQARFIIDLLGYALSKYNTIEKVEEQQKNSESLIDRLTEQFHDYQPQTPVEIVDGSE